MTLFGEGRIPKAPPPLQHFYFTDPRASSHAMTHGMLLLDERSAAICYQGGCRVDLACL
jgi:hypothetical protein